MTETLPAAVTNGSEWRLMCEWMLAQLGGGFHPDTDITDYVCVESGEPVFAPKMVGVLQPLLDQARQAIPEEALYAIAFAAMQERYPEIAGNRT